MNARLIRRKRKGQSIPVIALMIVVLFAMVGLAVDVGNTYAEQRSAVRASNASALVGMNTLIRGGDDTSIYNAVVNSLASNSIQVAAPGAQPQPGERVLTANYLDSSGNPLSSCPNVGGCGTTRPQGVSFIRVNLSGKVDTYFARVVGRPDLPVNSNAFAARGACTSGVYPIVIRDSYINQNAGQFVAPFTSYSDSVYRNKTQRRIFLKANATPNGGFSFARWLSPPNAGNEPTLEQMLAGAGNLASGFNEAAWPNSNALNLQMPEGYPIYPGQLTPGDWIYGNSGLSNSQSGSAGQLQWHITNRTEMILPIFDVDNGQDGINGNYHVSSLGSFLMTAYGNQNFTDQNGNRGWYLDLVYLGKANDCATLITNVPTATNLGISGQVYYRPRARQIPQSRPPVQYEIVLDVSGSMSWNFAGQGWKNGRAIQCTGTNNGCSGVANAWPDQTQRRIYIAKQAISSFINSMGTQDTMRIVTFSGDISSGNDQNAINQLTETAPNSWSSNKTTLTNALLSAGRASNNNYLTEGLTPSAVGLAAGNQAMASAPVTAPDGQNYKRVVIFVTDGVANVFRNGVYNNGGSGCGSEMATCHVGYTTSNPPRAKPITAMGIEAANLKQLATIYVIALADVDETGLRNVASDGNYPFFSKAPTGSELAGILESIRTDVVSGPCVPTGGNSWYDTLAQDNLGSNPADPVTYPTVGYVYLRDQNGNPLPSGQGKAPITIDSQSGRLTYRFDNLTPGTYQMSGFVAYKGADNLSRIYSSIFDPNTNMNDNQRTFQLSPSSSLGRVVPQDPLYMDLSGVVCP